MHQPTNQPRLNPATNGRARRFVTRTQTVRPVRLDPSSDRALDFVRHLLADPLISNDLCSVSMAVRRSIQLYGRHIERVRLDPARLHEERLAVRAMTMLPNRRKKSLPAGTA